MSTNQSLADDLVCALAATKQMGETMDDNHPMRHAVRSMKRTAEQILGDAARQARDLAYQAERLEKDYNEAVKGGAE